MEEKAKMFEYTYKIQSILNELPITIEAVVLARNYQDADRLFYWKILTEFTPGEYAEIIINAKLDNCDETVVTSGHDRDEHRGILMFSAVFDGKTIRDIVKQLDDTRGNLHPGWWTVNKPKTFNEAVQKLSVKVEQMSEAFGYPPEKPKWSTIEQVLIGYFAALLVIFFILLVTVLI